MCCTTVFDWLVQMFYDEDNELQEKEVETVSALQGANENDIVCMNSSDNVDTSGSDMSDDESDAEEA